MRVKTAQGAQRQQQLFAPGDPSHGLHNDRMYGEDSRGKRGRDHVPHAKWLLGLSRAEEPKDQPESQTYVGQVKQAVGQLESGWAIFLGFG